uniref:Uncharacterized protein n=1 Tax=Lonomia obliqua TaxID=304329 RepID=Q5MGF9_LONON|nr:hypothetical protein 28 [Lonomia obliqua]
MRAIVFFFFAILAMAAAQRDSVQVVDNSNQVPSDGQFVISNPDPFFSQPSNGPNGGYQQPDISPAFVDNSNQYRPQKHYDHPGARGGK